VRFQDVVDFSRVNFGRYKVDLMTFFENVLELVDIDFDPINRLVTVTDPTPYVLLKNSTFENEMDILHVTFGSSALLINNRFRSTLDLTGATFEAHNAGTSHTQETQPRLCLSYNRIHRLVLGLEHLQPVSHDFALPWRMM
jgi:hypothetical protein